MTEVYVAVSDALNRSVLATYGVVMQGRRDLGRPSYLPEPPAQTAAEYAGALAKLGRLGLVREN